MFFSHEVTRRRRQDDANVHDEGLPCEGLQGEGFRLQCGYDGAEHGRHTAADVTRRVTGRQHHHEGPKRTWLMFDT